MGDLEDIGRDPAAYTQAIERDPADFHGPPISMPTAPSSVKKEAVVTSTP